MTLVDTTAWYHVGISKAKSRYRLPLCNLNLGFETPTFVKSRNLCYHETYPYCN